MALTSSSQSLPDYPNTANEDVAWRDDVVDAVMAESTDNMYHHLISQHDLFDENNDFKIDLRYVYY